MSDTRTDTFNTIQELGEAAEFTIFSDNNSWSEVAEQYRALNSENDPDLADAVNAEMEQRGLLPAVKVIDGQLDIDDASVTEEMRDQIGLRNAVETFGTDEDRLRTVAELTAHGEDGQAAEEDIEAALEAEEGQFSPQEVRALQYLQDNFDDIHTDGWMNGNDISAEELLDHAEERGMSRKSIEDEAMYTNMAQYESLENFIANQEESQIAPQAESEAAQGNLASIYDPYTVARDDVDEQNELVPPMEQTETAEEGADRSNPIESILENIEVEEQDDQEPAEGLSEIQRSEEPRPIEAVLADLESDEAEASTYEVQTGDGFDRIARGLYQDVFGESPAPMDEILLSEYIAQLNNNDRSYGAGAIHPGQSLMVPSAEQLTAFFNQ